MDRISILAVGGLSDETVDLLNQVGWFLPLLAMVLPISLILFFVIGKPSILLLLILQGAGLYFGLRAFVTHLRHSGFSSFQVKIMLAPVYLVACFVTNIFVLLGFKLIRWLF